MFFSCKSQEKNINYDLEDMSSISLQGELLEPYLYAAETLQMSYIQSRICFFTPTDHEVCLVTNEKADTIGYFSKVGQGPGELNRLHYFSGVSATQDTIYMYDNMTHKLHTYHIQIRPNKVEYKQLDSKQTHEKDDMPDGFLKQTVFDLNRLANGHSIGIRFLTSKDMFTLFDEDLNEIKKFGEYPLDLGLPEDQIRPTTYFQGPHVAQGNSFYYATNNFGYMARYDVDSYGEITKVWENLYSNTIWRIDNGNIKISPKNPNGFRSLAIGDKYIYATYSEVKNEEMFKQRNSFVLTPQFLVILDLQGKPLAKFMTEGRIEAFCIDDKEEHIYVKHIDPDTSLWRYKISDIKQYL